MGLRQFPRNQALSALSYSKKFCIYLLSRTFFPLALYMNALPKTRIASIDLLKGLVMVIMALDHVRDYFHTEAFFYDPTDPTQSNLFLFFTRFITHFCAPTFCFLAGLSAFMVSRRKTKAELSSFLLKRGIWLVFLEFSFVTFAWMFDPLFRSNGFGVISMLGASMMILAGLIHLPRNWVLVMSILVILGHNLLDSVHFPGSVIWAHIHDRDMFSFSSGFIFYVDYPLIPWFAVMALGYCFGSFFSPSFTPEKRKKAFTQLGISFWILFLLLRFSNFYGESNLWINYESMEQSLMSFLQLSKYPPSLLYLLVTLGGMLLFLGNTEKYRGKVVAFFCVFGRVPFFYYILHLYLIHVLAAVYGYLSGWDWQLLVLPDWILELSYLQGYGVSLVAVYGIWIGVVLALYPLCKKYDRYKTQHPKKWWLSYL